MPVINRFPFLTQAEFHAACASLAERWDEYASSESLRINVKREDQNNYLVVTRSLKIDLFKLSESSTNLIDDEGDVSNEEIDDDDDAALPTSVTAEPAVEYHILLSQTYRVPVLYFFLRNLPVKGPRSIDAVYEYLVPHQFRSELRKVGVVGGISIGNHPVSDMPAFFVHPCNTADAMTEVAGNAAVTVDQYLQMWIGLVGSPVGFYLSGEFASQMVATA